MEETRQRRVQTKEEVKSRLSVSFLSVWPRCTWGGSLLGCGLASWKLPSENGRLPRSGSPGRELSTEPSWTTATLRLQSRPCSPCRASVWTATVCRLSWPRVSGEAGGPGSSTGNQEHQLLCNQHQETPRLTQLKTELISGHQWSHLECLNSVVVWVFFFFKMSGCNYRTSVKQTVDWSNMQHQHLQLSSLNQCPNISLKGLFSFHNIYICSYMCLI